MSSEEQKKILKMVEEGKILADEAVTLMKAIEEATVGGAEEVVEAEASLGPERSGPEFEEVKARARRFARIPLWIGVAFAALSSYWLYSLVQQSNYGFWFVCAWFPLTLGVLLMALAAGGLRSRWLYVNVRQAENDWPRNITLAFPLPLRLAGWAIRIFGHHIRGMDRTHVDQALMAISEVKNINEALVVNVNEGDDGEHVQVYIG